MSRTRQGLLEPSRRRVGRSPEKFGVSGLFEPATLCVILFAAGFVLLGLAISGVPMKLPPQLLASFAIISLTIGLRVAGGPAAPPRSDPT